MKSKEELNALKKEVETLNKKLHELTDEELAQVTGGGGVRYSPLHEGFAHTDSVESGLSNMVQTPVV